MMTIDRIRVPWPSMRSVIHKINQKIDFIIFIIFFWMENMIYIKIDKSTPRVQTNIKI